MRRKNVEQNKNARIAQVPNQDSRSDFGMLTQYREPGTLEARVDVRLRDDVETGLSLTGLSLRTSGGRNVRFTGAEARTLFRLLDRAVNG